MLVSEMAAQGITETCEGPWSAPVVLVKKKDGSCRFCVDYQRLNEVTQKNSDPLPQIEDALDATAGLGCLSVLDLRSGYWQVKVDPKDKSNTGFSVGCRSWQFKKMPSGLINAPASFEEVMELVL